MAPSSEDRSPDKMLSIVGSYTIFLTIGLGIAATIFWFVVLPALGIDPNQKPPSPPTPAVRVSWVLGIADLVVAVLSADILWLLFCKRSFERIVVARFFSLRHMTPLDRWLFNKIWPKPHDDAPGK